MKKILFLLIGLVLLSCSKKDEPDYSYLDVMIGEYLVDYTITANELNYINETKTINIRITGNTVRFDSHLEYPKETFKLVNNCIVLDNYQMGYEMTPNGMSGIGSITNFKFPLDRSQPFELQCVSSDYNQLTKRVYLEIQ